MSDTDTNAMISNVVILVSGLVTLLTTALKSMEEVNELLDKSKEASPEQRAELNNAIYKYSSSISEGVAQINELLGRSNQ